jgi:ketosteroid isomerase-like protein
MDATAQVAALYAAYQDRDWDRAATLLHPDAVVELPATSERLTGRDAVIAFQAEYPEPWGDLTVRHVLGGPQDSAAQIEIAAPDGQLFVMAAFWRQQDGLLRTATEYWITVGGDTIPDTRKAWRPGAEPA